MYIARLVSKMSTAHLDIHRSTDYSWADSSSDSSESYPDGGDVAVIPDPGNQRDRQSGQNVPSDDSVPNPFQCLAEVQQALKILETQMSDDRKKIAEATTKALHTITSISKLLSDSHSQEPAASKEQDLPIHLRNAARDLVKKHRNQGQLSKAEVNFLVQLCHVHVLQCEPGNPPNSTSDSEAMDDAEEAFRELSKEESLSHLVDNTAVQARHEDSITPISIIHKAQYTEEIEYKRTTSRASSGEERSQEDQVTQVNKIIHHTVDQSTDSQ
ncbi:hypothetical protein CALCODRAFT_557816 [Calocera cornea HHB12733]|uniref:Uncharacterized protein n=1 Tax=Calocera cornea HHB12733 TaxID=1353952 RepID=A0A165DJH8_9BASI|nr:hypothetical protein CALCODRAFT_557816 [Calocera cornea HHB12733]